MPTDPTTRTLRLLALLQSADALSSADIARELHVSPRTVRRDTERLRGLGYPVQSRPGPGSGYRLDERASTAPPATPAEASLPAEASSPTAALRPVELAAARRALRRDAPHDAHAAAALRKLGGEPAARRSPAGCALYRACSMVRARMPSVALKLASGITGNRPLPR